ncbi:Putative MFS transporter superfamily [Septoria linicola]|uniref:MFS transporter superfamily n=1 Tax=Septoria linicola TaxID=215465 RepID=A0A9Q9EN27_9PEZI|nr:Putative MFS transporter superfamily [Septoria linicola]
MPSQTALANEASFREALSLLKEVEVCGAEDDEPDRCSNLHLAAAGCTLWGLQLVWSTIFARGTAYLSLIGIPMSVSALLWISGPLSGMIVQPILGAISDSYEPKVAGRNKRKPFILGGAIATAISMTGLAWTPNIVVFLEQFFGREYETTLLIVNAFVWVWSLSISVQPLQGGVRTLLHEVCSKRAQSRFAAWQGVLVAFGTVCGYFLASVPIGGQSGAWQEIWRFQNLSALVAVVLLLCSAITVACPYTTSYKKTTPSAAKTSCTSSLTGALQRNMDCLRTLPRTVQLTLQVQFFSWLGWFPALYYQTAYLAGLYKSTRRSGKAVTQDVAEQAAFDSVPFTIVMLSTAIALALASEWLDFSAKRAKTRSTTNSLIMLVNLWLAGHVLFAIAMVLCLFAQNEWQGVWLFALIGVPRALSTWAPFVLVGREVTGSQYAGTLTSLHNAALSAPQILAAGLCGVLFMLVKLLAWDGQNQTRWAMLVACVSGGLATWRSWHLRHEVMSQV